MLLLEETATRENFDEQAYLDANPDVAAAVSNGSFSSGVSHFELFGEKEGRKLTRARGAVFQNVKRSKLERIKSICDMSLPYQAKDGCLDFLTDELRWKFNIIDTNAVSSNHYDGHVLSLIERHKDGLVLDCGAGSRQVYFDNVVNFEIAAYPSTDVLGVGESLPFKDGSFDAVISIAVLEHVKDPFLCASEIIRVLKPGGEIICCVPFLQPLHGYPHHYYNMTEQGLKNLFAPHIEIDRHEVIDSVLPIWSLTWIISSWSTGLIGAAKESFLNMKISDFLEPPEKFLNEPFVSALSSEKNFELASATVIYGRKK